MDVQPFIQVVSDVVCPWCYIGKRRLEKSLQLLGRKDVAVHWTAFQLNPNAPLQGWNRREYRIAKFGSAAVSERLEGRVIEAGRQEDIHFRFDRIEKTPNTFDAHRLIWLAGSCGVQDAIVESVFRAYFLDGRNIGDRSVLREIATASGIESHRTEELYSRDLGAAEVTDEEEQARLQGVSGVPTFFVSGQAVTSGAHPPQLLASMLGASLGAEVCSADPGKCA